MSTQAERASRRRKDKQKQRKKKKQLGAPYLVTRALTHIRLDDANTGKLAALDTLTPVYLALCQQYVEQFCNEESPNALFPPCYPSVLSERWQRACIMQAAGIAKSWLSNRTNAARAHQEALTRYQEALKEYEAESQRAEQDKKTRHPKAPRAPRWNEWPIPVVKAWCLQANVNVARIEPSEDSSFDYWLTVATLEKGKPIRLPVKLADYHKKTLTKREKPSEDIEADVLPMPLEVTAAPYKRPLNSSVTLNKRDDAWWLTVTYDDEIVDQTPDDAPVVGIDVGIANLVTTSTNKHYGTMHGKLRAAHKRDRGKRQRKAKLRACLKKKGAK